ncbi:hypothetical protein [Rouxiella sp. Mn2063]|uniref:hypothetical protein n=1 Tax=Rouxiella sp. Mn2063 TaxID=3395262 RepID=UPI003BEDD17D
MTYAYTATLFCESEKSEKAMIKQYEEKGYVVDESSLINRKSGDGVVMILKEQTHDS